MKYEVVMCVKRSASFFEIEGVEENVSLVEAQCVQKVDKLAVGHDWTVGKDNKAIDHGKGAMQGALMQGPNDTLIMSEKKKNNVMWGDVSIFLGENNGVVLCRAVDLDLHNLFEDGLEWWLDLKPCEML